ncbi:MAG: hypothetical protein IJU19_00860 [Bacteroidales bacterium]|nr:hypothetical protein [Bacteroidales bacterium]
MLSKTYSEVRTVEQSLATKTPSLLAMVRQGYCNRKLLTALLMAHLVNLDAFLKAKKGLSTEEIELITEEVIEKYGWVLTMADLHLIFRNAKLGKYGELYNNLTCAKVIKWFDDYHAERMDTAERMSREADEKRYSDNAVPDNFSLDMLGYTRDEDGVWHIDPDKVQARNEAQIKAEAVRRTREDAKAAERREAQQEYFRLKHEAIIRSILAKPEEERTDNECEYLRMETL